ncbi:MAG: hypothetical protein LBR13_00735 [Dysgonamonadaceae bacterium]|jgi:mannose-6-phosphate isomerase-like protein (cupin superfamily)|nr:hypothetical protein [Dysgonamonadaceae bacterium]
MHIYNELDKDFLTECSLCKREDYPSIEMLKGEQGTILDKRTVSAAFVFVLKGRVEITSGFAVSRTVTENRFFLLPPEVPFNVRFAEKAELIMFNLMDEVVFCEKHLNLTPVMIQKRAKTLKSS